MSEYGRQERTHDWRDEARRMRKRAGLNQTQLAHRMGTKQSAISELETGRTSPTVNTLEKYAEAIGCMLVVRFLPEGSVFDSNIPDFQRVPATGVTASMLSYAENHEDPYTPESRVLQMTGSQPSGT